MRSNLTGLTKMTQDRSASQKKMSRKISENKSAKKTKRQKRSIKQTQVSNPKFQKIDYLQNLPTVCQHSNLLLEDHSGTAVQEVTPLCSYQEAAALLLYALENKGTYCLLSWPIGFEWPGLIAALASRALSERCTDVVKLRVLLYPSSRTTAGRYNGIRVPCGEILAEPRTLLERQKMDLSLRHQALLCLNDVNDLNDNRKHPRLKDLTPFFEWDKDKGQWIKYGSDYFDDIYKLIGSAIPGGRRRAGRRTVIRDYAKTLTNPNDTPEGIFQIPGSIRPKLATNILKDADADVIVIDVRDIRIRHQPGLLKQSVILAEHFSKEAEKPSLFFLFNDLPHLNQFKGGVLTAYKKTNKKLKRKLKPFSESHWLRSNDNIFGLQDSAIYYPETIFCHVTDASSLHAVSQLHKIAKNFQNNGGDSFASGIRKLAGFLRRVIDLPIGQKPLQEWMSHITKNWSENDTVRCLSKFLWAAHFRRWKHEYPEHAEQRVTQNISEIAAQSLHEQSLKSAIQIKLGDLVKSLVDNQQNVLVLINDCMLIGLVEEYVAGVLGKTCRHNIDVTCFNKLKSYADYDVLIVAGFNRDNYKYLFGIADRIPKECHLILGAYSAAQIHDDFRLLSSIDSYKAIHPLIHDILDQIDRPVSSFKRLGIPLDLKYKTGELISRSYRPTEQTETYAIVDLLSHAPLEVGEHSNLMRHVNDSAHPYEVVYPNDLDEGDAVLAMDDAFMNKIEDIVEIELVGQGGTKAVVRAYFTMAKEKIAQLYPQPTRLARSIAVLKKMKELGVANTNELNTNMVQRWLKHIEDVEVDDNENDISSGSAREKKHFLLFTRALDIGPDLAEIFWQQGIKALRVNHIQMGRQTSNLIRQLLTGSLPYSSLNIDEQSYDKLLEIARENTFSVELITYLEQQNNESTTYAQEN